MPRKDLAALFLTVVVAGCDHTGQGDTPPTAPGDSAASVTAGVSDENRANVTEPDERMVKAVQSRKAVLVVLKDNFVPLALMAMGRRDYDPVAARTYAARLPVMLGMMEERFATDTRGSGVETEALDVIWEDMDGFRGKIRNALTAANHLAAVADDETQFEGAVTDLRDRCGSCHDDFRVDND